jgi:CheY-specific phosphatase CheX
VLSKKVLALVTARHGKVCLLAEKRLDSVGEAFAGQIVRTFVPETFAAEVAELLAGAALGESGESWMKSLEPEITSAVRQALGMMTGSEPTFGENASEDVDADLFGVIELQASNGEFDLVVDLHCQRVFAVALCTAMLGGEADDVDDELLMSGVGEILNVVAGRIKNSCADRKIGITPGLPKLFDSTPDELDPFYAWEQNFIWRKQHRFRLRVSGKAGTARPADAATAADSPAAPAEDRPAAAKQPGAPAGDVASQTRAEPRSAEPHTGGPAPEAEASAGATRVASSRAEAGPADASSGGDVQETTESDGAAQGAEGED